MIALAEFLATLFVANMIWIVFVVFKFGRAAGAKGRIRSAFALDTSEGLIKQGLLWASILAPILSGFAMGFWAWKGNSILLSSTGFENFLKISLVPLGIMSISLPLAGLVARIHSTQQAAKQIYQAEVQIRINSFKSNLDAFYAHRKGLVEYFSLLPDISYFGLITFDYKIHPSVHKRFFHGVPEEGWPTLNERVFTEVENQIITSAELLTTFLERAWVSEPDYLDRYLVACTGIISAAKSLGIKKIYHDIVQLGVTVKVDGGSNVTLGVTTVDVLASIRFVRDFFDNLCDYAGRDRMRMPEALETIFRKTETYLKKKSVECLHGECILDLMIDELAFNNEESV
ncbi:hypothetical protein [Pseudomonas viridiflava]|uniref:hypothetical protein n=1 Tax=Pseudomonas viridiflava TaxID=33069 RepID=UPI000F02E012|nr:hypothetical protein [Pseudomonas viridiflava]